MVRAAHGVTGINEDDGRTGKEEVPVGRCQRLHCTRTVAGDDGGGGMQLIL